MKVTINVTVLRNWMVENNKRAEDIASISGLGFATVQSALRKKTIARSTLLALCSATGLHQDELIDKRKRHHATKGRGLRNKAAA